jgi:hypothetical protein
MNPALPALCAELGVTLYVRYEFLREHTKANPVNVSNLLLRHLQLAGFSANAAAPLARTPAAKRALWHSREKKS